jgi:hypothetical protein
MRRTIWKVESRRSKGREALQVTLSEVEHYVNFWMLHILELLVVSCMLKTEFLMGSESLAA